MTAVPKKGYVWTLPTMETHGRAATEHEEQTDFVRWFRRAYTIPLGVRIFAIPNGSAVTSKAQGAKLMSEGVSPGVPDLCVPAWGPLWIEMKRPKKSHTSELQKLWHEYLRGLGQTVIKPNGSAEAQAMVQEFLAARSVDEAMELVERARR